MINKEEAELMVKGRYPALMNEVDSVIRQCLACTDLINEKRREWVDQNDVRFSVYGRYVSLLQGLKIGLYQAIHFQSHGEWEKLYEKEFLLRDERNNFSYMKEFDTLLRFAFFMKFVSQYEADLRIIIRHLKVTGARVSDDPKGFVTGNLELPDYQNLLDIVQHTRNSIHNNGFHVPILATKNCLSKQFREVNLEFIRGKKIEIGWSDVILVAKYLVEMTEDIIQCKLVGTVEHISDSV